MVMPRGISENKSDTMTEIMGKMLLESSLWQVLSILGPWMSDIQRWLPTEYKCHILRFCNGRLLTISIVTMSSGYGPSDDLLSEARVLPAAFDHRWRKYWTPRA